MTTSYAIRRIEDGKWLVTRLHDGRPILNIWKDKAALFGPGEARALVDALNGYSDEPVFERVEVQV